MIEELYLKLGLTGHIGYCGRSADAIFLKMFEGVSKDVLTKLHLFDQIYKSGSIYDRLSSQTVFSANNSKIIVLPPSKYPYGYSPRKVVTLNTIDEQAFEKLYSVLIFNDGVDNGEIAGFNKVIARDNPVLILSSDKLQNDISRSINEKYHPGFQILIGGCYFYIYIPVKYPCYISNIISQSGRQYNIGYIYDVTPYIKLHNFYKKEYSENLIYWWSGSSRFCLINAPLFNGGINSEIEIIYEDKYKVDPVITGVFDLNGNFIDANIFKDSNKIKISNFRIKDVGINEVDIIIKMKRTVRPLDSHRDLGFLLYKVQVSA